MTYGFKANTAKSKHGNNYLFMKQARRVKTKTYIL